MTNELRITIKRACTWNFRSLDWEDAAAQLVDIRVGVKADITAVQEVRLTGQELRRVGSCGFYYSGYIKKRIVGVGFVAGERLCRQEQSLTPVDEQLVTIRISAKRFNTTLICTHASTEKKDDMTKDVFNELLGRAYDDCPYNDVKTVLCDFTTWLV